MIRRPGQIDDKNWLQRQCKQITTPEQADYRDDYKQITASMQADYNAVASWLQGRLQADYKPLHADYKNYCKLITSRGEQITEAIHNSKLWSTYRL